VFAIEANPMEQGWFCNPRRIQGKVLKLSGAADYRAQKRFASKQTASGDENACFDGRMQRYTKMVLPYTIVVALIQKKSSILTVPRRAMLFPAGLKKEY